MTTAYLIQTYHLPAQALRLASTIRAGSPDSVIIISHDRDAATGVDPGMGDVADSVLHGPGGRGDFGTVDRYLDCLAWIARETDGVDWVINITGQDYPIRPLAEVEAELASTSTDGFLEFFAAMDPFCRWGRREARDRYLYRYRWLRGQLSLESRRAIRPLLIINRVQPYVRLTVSYGLAIGRRSRVVPFGRDLPCYGGAFYGALSWKAVSVVRERTASDPALEAHFRRTLVPEEAILQTLVVGARGLAIQNDSRRYYDFRGSVAGSPRVLTTDDLERVLESDAWFARKFDERVDAEVLDRLDEVVTAVPGSSGIAGT